MLIVVNRCQPFQPHEPHVILLRMICTYACFTFLYIGKIPDGYQIAKSLVEFRLVINQSVVPLDLEFSPEERSVFPLSTI
jgi:hypothetical protein